MATVDEYVLGTGDDELARLGAQHQLWRAEAYRLWELAGFRSGQRLLDLGAGPGYTTLDLAELVGSKGAVLGVDLSSSFLATLRERAARQGLSNVTTLAGDLVSLTLPTASFAGAYARWLFCFVPDPEAVVARVAQALAPGGALVVQDYLDWEAIGVAPRSAIFERVTRAVAESWRQHGGDTRICTRLPAMMERHGLRVERLEPISRVSRTTEPLWSWPDAFFRTYVPKLVAMGLLSSQEQREFSLAWAELSADPGAFFCSPLLLNVVARRSTR